MINYDANINVCKFKNVLESLNAMKKNPLFDSQLTGEK